ncbi:MAG: hypothetical protein ACP5K9_01815 [Candidatus Micrarchaeia archaeon]
MKKYTYYDLRNYLIEMLYLSKYRKLSQFLKSEVSEDPDFNFFEYLLDNKDKVLFTAKNSEMLIEKRDEFIKNKFRLMRFGIIEEIKSKIDDYLLNYYQK